MSQGVILSMRRAQQELASRSPGTSTLMDFVSSSTPPRRGGGGGVEFSTAPQIRSGTALMSDELDSPPNNPLVGAESIRLDDAHAAVRSYPARSRDTDRLQHLLQDRDEAVARLEGQLRFLQAQLRQEQSLREQACVEAQVAILNEVENSVKQFGLGGIERVRARLARSAANSSHPTAPVGGEPGMADSTPNSSGRTVVQAVPVPAPAATPLSASAPPSSQRQRAPSSTQASHSRPDEDAQLQRALIQSVRQRYLQRMLSA